MNHFLQMSFLCFAVLAIAIGCEDAAVEKANESVPHVHEHGDELVWKVKEKVGDTNIEIWLGHHGTHFHGGDSIEPAVVIAKDGKALADAKVFVQLADPNSVKDVLTEETATVFEPETEEEIAHYAQGKLKLPADATKCLIRCRIEIPAMDEISRDVSMDVGH